MASSDMDPVYKKALRLLHSKSEDAEEQLRMMLDDAIRQRYGNERTLTNYLNKKESSNKRDNPKKTSSDGGSKDHKDAHKKHHVQMAEVDTSESSWEATGAKKKGGSDIKKSSHSKQLLAGSSLLSPEKLPLACTSKLDDYEEEKDENDLPLEFLEDDLTCVICRGMDIGARNQMIECVECKSLYHQECHQPPVSHSEINDSRSTWYCANCTEAIKSRGASSNNLEKNTSGLNLIGITASQSVDMKLTFATSPTKSPSGLISPSSSFASSSKSCESLSQASAKPSSSSSSLSKSVVSATSSSKLVMPNINIVNADKKLHIKKKSTKHQEKKKHSKY